MTGPSSTDNGPRCDEGPLWLAHVPVTVNAHVRSGSVLEVSPHPQEGRLVVDIAGSNNVMVHLFTPRAELVRLIEVVTAGLAELDVQMAAAQETVSGTGTAGAESAA